VIIILVFMLVVLLWMYEVTVFHNLNVYFMDCENIAGIVFIVKVIGVRVLQCYGVRVRHRTENIETWNLNTHLVLCNGKNWNAVKRIFVD